MAQTWLKILIWVTLTDITVLIVTGNWFILVVELVAVLGVLIYIFDKVKGQWIQPKQNGPRDPDWIENQFGATEKFAKSEWWCPMARNRNAVTNVSGYNRSLFPIKKEMEFSVLFTLFPWYMWYTIGKHGKCMGSKCGFWRWHEFKRIGYCGAAPQHRSYLN